MVIKQRMGCLKRWGKPWETWHRLRPTLQLPNIPESPPKASCTLFPIPVGPIPMLLPPHKLWACLLPYWVPAGFGPVFHPAGFSQALDLLPTAGSPTILSPSWLSLLTYCTNRFGEGELADPPHGFPTVGWGQAQGLQGFSQVGIGPSGQDGRKAGNAAAALCHS